MSNPDPIKSRGKGKRLPPAIVAFPDASQQSESIAPAPEAIALGRYEVDVAACRPSPAARPVRPEHVTALARSIVEIGLLQPIVVRATDGGFEVMAGLHRLRAFEQLGRAQIPAIVRHDDDLRAELALIDENLIRNELTPAERAAQIARRKAIYEALHPETRHGASGKHRPKSQSRKVCDSEIEPPEPTARFTKATAEAIGQSERTIQLEAARGNDLGGDVLARVVRTSLDKGEELDALAVLAKEAPDQCYALITRAAEGEKVSAKVEVKKIARQKREAELGAKQAALPQQKFGVILADPEWKWRAWSDAGMDRGVENTYPTSETTDIAERDVLSIAADDCVLVLWARADMLPDALQVMAAWGFRYVAQRVWRKARMSTGYWFRYDHELVLIGSRGKPVAPAMGTQERSVFEGEPAVPGLNSSKPGCLAEWIERNWPNTPKIELNRRGPPRSGWAAWGNEASGGPEKNSNNGGGDAADRADARSPSENDFPSEDRIGAALAGVAAGEIVEDAAVRAVLQKDKLIRGKHKLKLTQAGTERLKAWMDGQEEARLLAELPDDIEALIADYGATLARRHAAIMGPGWQYIEGTAIYGRREEIVARETARLDRLQIKANGGTPTGMACDDSPSERLRAESAAPIGEVPMWGQRGMFRIEVDGLACLVTHDEDFGFCVRACSDAPFISETGFQWFSAAHSDGPAFWTTVDEQARAFVSEQMIGASGREGERTPKPMPTPKHWYRLPASWDEAAVPIRIGAGQAASGGDDLIEWKALGAIDADVTITGSIIERFLTAGLIVERSSASGGSAHNQPFVLTRAGKDRMRELDARFSPPADDPGEFPEFPACLRRGADGRPSWEAKAAQETEPETDAQTAPPLPDASAAAAESSDRDSAAVSLSETLPGEPAGDIPAEAAE